MSCLEQVRRRFAALQTSTRLNKINKLNKLQKSEFCLDTIYKTYLIQKDKLNKSQLTDQIKLN